MEKNKKTVDEKRIKMNENDCEKMLPQEIFANENSTKSIGEKSEKRGI